MAVPGVQNATDNSAPSASDTIASPSLKPLSSEQQHKVGLDLLIGAQARIATDRKVSAMRASRSNAKRQAPKKDAPTRVVTRKAPSAVLPVAGVLGAYYNQRGRMWSSGRHTGQDFKAPSGTAVRAVTAGKIVESGWDGAYGNRIVIEHADGRFTTYSHMSGFERRSGSVAAGEIIGYVGSTGNSTGPHLHFEVLDSAGDHIAPLTYLKNKGVRV